MARSHAVVLVLTLIGCAAAGGRDVEGAKACLEEGRAAARKGNHAGAVELYSQAIAANPEFPEAYFERGRSHVKLRRDEHTPGNVREHENEAYRDYTLAIKLNPAFADAYFNRAMLLSSRAQYKQAAEDLLNASRFNPKDPEAHYYLGWIYETYFEDKAAGAVAHYEKYLELGGTDAEVRRKVSFWKEIHKGAAPAPSRAPTAEDEEKAVKLHQQAMDLLKEQKRDDAIRAVETLLKDYGHTRYVREKKAQLEALLGAFKK